MLGFSVNTLTLFGLVLAIIVVDDAIVVVEAVQHHIEHGLNPREAIAQAMKEVSGPVIMIALALCAVFVPVAFRSGVTGQLYQQFVLTIARRHGNGGRVWHDYRDLCRHLSHSGLLRFCAAFS
jgi:HAE1 family hydrophobic/amphiphilic exporter-1